ncbi:DUF6069 family protein [Isoptericola sp. CG 20/1183]|nr:DUF6069 family protein [Isoptericola sp. CG 20/1183]
MTMDQQAGRTTPRGSGAGPSGRGGMFRRRTPAWGVPPLAAVVAAVVWAVATASGAELTARTGGGLREVGLVDVVVAGLVVGLLGWAARALLRRTTGDGERTWLVLCGAVLLVSLAGPLGAATQEAAGFLVAEHVAVGATIALGLRREVRRTPRGRGA